MDRRNQSVVGTRVERTTRALIWIPLKGREAESVRKALAKERKRLPRPMRLTRTYDRGQERAQHQRFTRETRRPVYGAHPQRP
ncbi:IS30 family transposase, partial [mine drainage metagenome]